VAKQAAMPTTRTRLGALLALAVLSAALVPAGATEPAAAEPAAATGPGLPTVASGPPPGPAVLHEPPPRVPQLENTGVWEAEPILVSGAEAYRDGEWLYQDFLHDDAGARGVPDLGDPYGLSAHLYSPRAGTFTYPTDPVYANNAADLVELRIRPLDDATAFRVTLNTLQDPALTAFTIALGGEDDGAAVDWPHGAGVSSPAGRFLTWHGEVAELRAADTGEPITPAPTATVDLERRQVEVRVPHAAWDPGTDAVRVTIGVGLWDVEGDAYLAPRIGPASEDTPGGGNPLGVALVNVGPRLDEPQPEIRGKGYTMADTALLAKAEATWWRELAQGEALALGDVSPFAATVDFGKLAGRVTDDSGVPTSGSMNRILPSRFSFGQGLDPDEVCFGITAGVAVGSECRGRFLGQLQSYAVYVPDREPPAEGFGLTLLLHSLSANHNQYANSVYQRQLGERGAGTVVVTPSGRAPDGFYAGFAEADTFEVWADVARHHPIDPSWVVVSGYSMGGFGTYRLLARYPDLFAGGFSVVGIPGSAMDQLASLLHTPLKVWNAAADELVHVTDAEQAHGALVEAGVEHAYRLFPTADHLTLASHDEFGDGAEFLGERRAVVDPARVRYVVDPSEDNADAGVVAERAYWLVGLEVRGDGVGTVEAHSEALGTGRLAPGEVEQDAGVLTGGFFGPMPFVERSLALAEGPAIEPADRLVLTMENLSRVVVDPARAGLTCDAEVVLDSDGPVDVVLAGCPASAGETPVDEPTPEATPVVEPAPAPSPARLPATGTGAVSTLVGLLLLAGGAALGGRRRAARGGSPDRSGAR
jgi:hypothetical protein